MRAVVTGATGFVGGHVARLLAERGDEVTATYRNPERLARLRELDVREVKADVLDRAGLRRAMRDAEVAFHTAGYVGSQPKDQVWKLNAPPAPPRLVLGARPPERVPRVVVPGSVAAIGPSPDGGMAEEGNVYRGGDGA